MSAKGKDEPALGVRGGEPRWPVAAAILAAIALQVIAPHAGRPPGWWIVPVLELVLLGTLITGAPGRINGLSRRASPLTVGLLAVLTIGLVAALVILMIDIIHVGLGISAAALLGRGAALWVSNVIVFSLWYWLFDRSGPAQRADGTGVAFSFAFPENAMPELASAGWSPRYADYLYLSFTNATAFSPTDTLPLRRWAKMAMMLEAVISLLTAVLVIARAVNVLPG